MLQQLMPHYGLFCVDLEGHGDSDRPTHFSGSKAIARRIAPVIADQQPGGQALVGMGHSYGAALTVRAAAENPHLFRALVLLDPILLPTSLWLGTRSEEHTSELQSLMRISSAVFCFKKKT